LGNHIGELNEKSLHAALKAWYAQPDDRLEVSVDGYVIDIVRQDTLIEIQTGNFTALKDKLYDLTERHPVRLVYPMAREKWILKLDPKGLEQASRRKSPRRGKLQDLFYELVRIPDLVSREHFSLEVLWIKEEEVRRYEAGRAWRRRGWVVQERRLLEVVGEQLFHTPADMGALLPTNLDEPFTTRELHHELGGSKRLAGKMAYCLREMGAIRQVGKRGRAYLYMRQV
jgi:hypothetical protein